MSDRDAREPETRGRRKSRQLAMQHPVAVREDWETPPDFFAALDREFGFTLDVCATAANAKCARYLCPVTDGLRTSWDGQVCWMNPPSRPAPIQPGGTTTPSRPANVGS